MLRIEDIHVHYGYIHAIKGISLEVDDGEIATLIGSNGAGKSTTLGAVMGLVPTSQGKIFFQDKEVTNSPPHQMVRKGVGLAPEGREVFPALTVEENLRLGAYTISNHAEIKESFNFVYNLFPRLKERINQQAGTLSGGEQQMLAIGRALMCHPKLLLLDEPSLGLAPTLVTAIFELITEINKQGITILLIEQNASMALSVANHAYVLETGNVAMYGSAKELSNDPRVIEAYLGVA